MFRRDQQVDDHHQREEGDAGGDYHDQTAIGPDFAALDREVHEVVMAGGQDGEYAAESHHRHADWQRRAVAADGYLRVEPRGEFAQPDAELGDDEAEADDGDAGPDPRQKRPLVGEEFAGTFFVPVCWLSQVIL